MLIARTFVYTRRRFECDYTHAARRAGNPLPDRRRTRPRQCSRSSRSAPRAKRPGDASRTPCPARRVNGDGGRCSGGGSRSRKVFKTTVALPVTAGETTYVCDPRHVLDTVLLLLLLLLLHCPRDHSPRRRSFGFTLPRVYRFPPPTEPGPGYLWTRFLDGTGGVGGRTLKYPNNLNVKKNNDIFG